MLGCVDFSLMAHGVELSDNNLNILDLLISSFHSERMMRDAAKFFSPDYYYISLNQGKMNFDEYCSHIGATAFDCELEVINKTWKNDHFDIEIIFHMLDNPAKIKSNFLVIMSIYITDGIVQNISSKLSSGEEAFAKYSSISGRHVEDE